MHNFSLLFRRAAMIASALLCLGPQSGFGDADGSGAVGPTGTTVLTVQEAIRLALLHHPDFRAGAWRVEAAEGRAKQLRLWPNPELQFSAEEMPTDGGGLSGSLNQAGIAQTVPFPGKSMLDGRIGRLAVRESEADLGALRIELEKGVKIAFARLLAAEGLVAVARELVGVAQKEATVARERANAGGVPAQEQLRAEIAWEQAKTQLTGFEGELEVARRGLAGAIGRPDLASASIRGSLRESADFSMFDRGRGAASASHPTLQAAETARDRAQAELRRAQIDPMPDVTLGISGGRDEAANAGIMGFRVSLPLPLIDRSQAKTREARAEAAIAENAVEAARQRLAREWAEAESRLRSADAQANAYRTKILPKALEALQLVQTGFEQGKFPFIDLLDTQRTVAETRLAYQQKLLELGIAQAELEALLQPWANQTTPR
ncbi:MAG TPA: TolC family protein [Verrucomicrobiae bacterium]|nr:TolC family protein [Verrucomicrobiae bacterium]